MKKVPYINYGQLAGFYTVQQVADLLCMSMQKLVEKCEQLGIKPRIMSFTNDHDRFCCTRGFYRSDIRKLRKALHQESQGNKKAGGILTRKDDPWA